MSIFKERAIEEGFKNPDDEKTLSAYRWLLPEKSVWQQIENKLNIVEIK